MFVVCVTFAIKPGAMAQFMPLMARQSRQSRQLEPDCHQFDVCSDGAEDEVFLYEVYSDAAAFDAHLTSQHFVEFDRSVADLVVAKSVKTYTRM